MKKSLDNYSARNQKRMTEAKERAELLGRAVCKSLFWGIGYADYISLQLNYLLDFNLTYNAFFVLCSRMGNLLMF